MICIVIVGKLTGRDIVEWRQAGVDELSQKIDKDVSTYRHHAVKVSLFIGLDPVPAEWDRRRHACPARHHKVVNRIKIEIAAWLAVCVQVGGYLDPEIGRDNRGRS